MKKTLMCLALALTPFASQASEANKISYSYAELDYVHKDVSNAATNAQ